VAAVVLVAIHALPPLAIADRLVEDIVIAHLAPPQPQANGIAVIAITEATLSTLPYRAPLDRGLLAGLVLRLRARQVRAIGLDVLIDQPTETAKDAALLTALSAPGPPVVLVDAASMTQLTQRQRQFLDGFLTGLRRGNGNLARDRLDGAVRQHYPFLDGKPSLPAALAQAVGVTPPAEPFTIAWIRTGKPDLPAVPVYPVETLSLLPAAWLADKIVLVGLVTPDTDRHRTPLTVGEPPMAGVEIQAQVLAQILDGRHALPASTTARTGAVIAAAVAGTLLAAAGLPLWAVLALMVAGAAALWLGSAAVVLLGGPLLSPLAPSLTWMAAIGTASVLASVRERTSRAMLMSLFAAHLSKPVAEEIWRFRTTFLAGDRPRPQRLIATVMFSDIEGFTPASEHLAPEMLMDWLETYLEAMTDIITGHDGIVLRFIGDGILAAFGAPLPRADARAIDADAERAVRAALAMDGVLVPLNQRLAEQGLPLIAIRVGIVTGPMVGGSIGARRHLEYTLLGDVVNTAARLEALARTVEAAPGSPCRILVAESTWRRVARLVTARPIGAIALKGKEDRVEVYQILGLAAGPPGRGDGRGAGS
jgi:class 3 adenylate cyclase/CHASE2 domain-containing sensor protein